MDPKIMNKKQYEWSSFDRKRYAKFEDRHEGRRTILIFLSIFLSELYVYSEIESARLYV